VVLVTTCAVLCGCFTVRKESVHNDLVNLQRVEELETQTGDPTFRATTLGFAGLTTPRTPVRRVDRASALGGPDDVVAAPPEATPGTPPATPQAGGPTSTAPAAHPATVVVAPLDALVGQISGRPLFASDFFGTMDARMLAESAGVSEREFLGLLREQITASLRDEVRDELLLAEFEASLTPQQRQGLGSFVAGIREQILRANAGSAEQAHAILRTSEGLTLDEKVEAESHQQLVRQQVGRLLRHRAWIPWRDVRREYLRHLDEFRPLPTARLRVIMVPADDAQLAADVQSALEAGDPFGDIAEEFSTFRPEQGGIYEVAIDAAGYEQTEIFADPGLNARAAALTEGETIGPFDWSGRRVWLTLESVRAHETSLYAAQERILGDLRQQRLAEVQAEFFQKLLKRGSLSDIDRMEQELFRLGAERYLVAGRHDSAP